MALMPKGAYPAGMFGSVNEPSSCTCLKVRSNTSTVPAWKLVAKRKTPLELGARARPLYTAPLPAWELSTARIAWKRSTLGLHAASVPSSVANMKTAGDFAVPTVKPCVGFHTTPVGVALKSGAEPAGPGICTANGTSWLSARFQRDAYRCGMESNTRLHGG